ncbi:two-component sensor histidine kinase [Malaciobacter molluscorum LMG 25693]|uniref:histidine kinase n=1 Tax=Malaciobacter molluscorum LMG 25693 TaxID=870501 RepID=A0A2G1DJY1_9BACT|nr:HAMP domain-containing sensor histidine kinase [Malaciobacter molluscorum]AXX91438.1 two-component system sensor histidine kinase [Malaciobacter molluscorum LMG 25693]PHO18815.1 two-component sensor histidine kinase [Malaciobacter molluscorum LMG 25693]RXJ94431.1 two-component sensor histidine kinase [Malaciobacter molluscorum]
MNTKSIYKQFYQKLILATSLFITTLSFIFYGYTKATIYEELKESLVSDAQLIYKISKSKGANKTNFNIITHTGITVDLVTVDNLSEISFETFDSNGDYYVELLYPFDIKSKKFIKIIKNINSSREMLTKIFNNLLFLSLGGLILVVLYAFTVSKTLLRPIIQITKKLSNMNEHYLTQIKKDTLPIEFHPLADSINSLTNRIETYVKFKKELFIGAAHELKTPLAVMKLKNEVTLMKQRDAQKYQDTLKLTIKQIDDMNKMIGSILDIGRAEGAQFEKPVEVDLVQYMQRKTNDYRMLSAQKKITITFYANVNYYNILLQVTLLNQIIQNFVQNAIKFTPEEHSIAIRLEKNKEFTTISVTDDGIGIDENIDLFAPFKRVGTESGAGLGLFLAKNAADAMGAKISLENRKDGKLGCVAKLMLYNNPVCKLS